MKTKDIYHFLEMIDKDGVRDQIVPCFMGCPGIGKTHEIERYAKDRGKKVVHIIASQILPSEVSGITMPDKEAGGMTVYDHVRLSSLKDGDILFFDELLQGQQQVLSACLTLIQERRLMSDKPLPDVMIVAAANPLANPNQLPAAIRDRFLFIGMEFDFVEWKQYMKDSQDIIIEDSIFIIYIFVILLFFFSLSLKSFNCTFNHISKISLIFDKRRCIILHVAQCIIYFILRPIGIITRDKSTFALTHSH